MKTNFLLKRNISVVQSEETKTIGMLMLAGMTSYSTLPHGDNLITDTKFYIDFIKYVTMLNTILVNQLDIMASIIKKLATISNDNSIYELPKLKFDKLDIEGKTLQVDMYNNIIPD